MELKPGTFYIGGYLDPAGERREPLLYDRADLTTHGVILGMTGSGKTGLGIDLLEEALLAGIPALIIDPKGDMGNLLLNFPDLRPEDFRPWIDEVSARREGVGPDELARRTAADWREGLAGWEIGSERMRALGAGAEFSIFTPGSAAGIALNVLGSMRAPSPGTDTETMREEIEGLVSSLLVLAGIDSDPISGPEHILIATIIETAWSQGSDLDLTRLIGRIQRPPFRKLGVFELESFLPTKSRTALAMSLNGLLASPSFTTWLEGAPLDIPTMLGAGGDRPRAAIIYMAHLSDSERQFVVTLLLSKLVTWMRRQTGASDLRVLVYMDEVFGYCPPSAEPPAKRPLLTLLKQARAYGVGVVLSTQNPVDLDYKAISNAGTWMIGRLQTERDKLRVLEGLRSAAGGVDLDAIDRAISGLGKRQFVLHTSRGAEPRLFTSRWAMSYLAGPFSKEQVGRLMEGVAIDSGVPTADHSPAVGEIAEVPPRPEDASVPVPPAIAPGVAVRYLDPAAPWAATVRAGGGPAQRAVACVTVHLRYDDRQAGIDHTELFEAVIDPLTDPLDPAAIHVVDHDPRDLLEAGPEAGTYSLPAAPVDQPAFYSSMRAALSDYLVANHVLTIWRNPAVRLFSRVGEDEQAFRSRCSAAAEEAADAEVARLEVRYRARLDRVKRQLLTAERRVSELEAGVAARRQQELLSGAGDLLGALLGGRRRASSLGRAASRRSATRQAEARLDTAAGTAAGRRSELEDLEDELAAEIESITSNWESAAGEIESVPIPLEKTDIRVDQPVLVWVPAGEAITESTAR
jgi:hypothetical protein